MSNVFTDLYNKVSEALSPKENVKTASVESLEGKSALEIAEMCKEASESKEESKEAKESDREASTEDQEGCSKEESKEAKEEKDESNEESEQGTTSEEKTEKTASLSLVELIVKIASEKHPLGITKTASVNDRNRFLAEVENTAYAFGLEIIRGGNGR